MNKTSSKIFISFFAIIILIIIGIRYKTVIIDSNYEVSVNTFCDPSAESCFKQDCSDPSLGCETEPYKKVDILAKDAPACLEEHTCSDFSCGSLASCEITNCSIDNVQDGEGCIYTESVLNPSI